MRWEIFFFNEKTLGQISIVNICLLVFSYPITAAIPVLLGINSTPINIGLRIIYLGLSLYLVFGVFVRTKYKSLSVGGWLLLLFWLIYSIRVNYDIHVKGIIFASSSIFKFYTIFYGSGILAATATLLTTKYIDLKDLRDYIYKTIIGSNVSIVIIVFYLYKTFNPIVIAARVNFSVELGDGSVIVNVLNPITIGFFGELAALLSLYYLWFDKNTKIKRFLHYLGFFLGLYVLLVGGSKGPFISFFVIALFLILLKLIQANKSGIFFLKLFTIPSIFFVFFIEFVLPEIPWQKLTIFVRMKSWLTDDYSNSLDNRDEKYTFAWEQFLENPIIGSRYLDQFNSYPHNIFLEVLMALGMVGGILIGMIFFIVLLRIFLDAIGSGRYIFFSVLVLAQILSNITSGSLFASYPFWTVLALYLSINNRKKHYFFDKILRNNV